MSVSQAVENLELDLLVEKLRPFLLHRPRLARDGNKWICCYGDNLQEGVVGIGDSPDLASRDFDKAWYASLVTSEAGKDTQ